MAEPQEDNYDSFITLSLAKNSTSLLREKKYVRRALPEKGPVIFDGKVAVRPFPYSIKSKDYVPGPIDHPNIWLAVEYVRRWNAVFRQFQFLIDTFYPMDDPTRPQGSHGSQSGAYEKEFGAIHATVYDPIALAGAFVHEMAHQKLRALGVSFEGSTRLIRNSQNELYVSPVIKNRKRPMTAVFHATYSFTYVTELDLRILDKEWRRTEKEYVQNRLRKNLSRIEEGVEQILKYSKFDKEGKCFFEGYYSWFKKLKDSGYQRLYAKSKTSNKN